MTDIIDQTYLWSRPAVLLSSAEARELGSPIAEAHAALRVETDSSWYQGRGVFGGVSAAILLESMRALEPERAPRSMTVQCVAPTSAGATLALASRERRGGRVTHLSSRLYCGADTSTLCAFASATFGAQRGEYTQLDTIPAPQAPSPQALTELTHPTLMPPFAQHFIYWPCLGAGLYSGDPQPILGGWCDIRAPGPVTYALIAALLDAWAPALFVSLKRPMVAASVDFSYHFCVTPDELEQLKRPFLYRGEAKLDNQGYIEERDLLWDSEGTLVATSRQLIAVG